MLTTAQHRPTSSITSAAEQKSVQKCHISTKYPNFILATANFSSIQPQEWIQSRIPKLWPMNGLVGLRLRTGQRVKEYVHVFLHGCLMSLEKKARQQANSRPTTACWATVVDALWAMFQYQIKNHMSLSAGRCASFKSPRYAECLDTRDNNVCASLHCHFTGIIQPVSAV